MRTMYDPDATALTRDIYASLRMRGFRDWVQAGRTLQTEIEDEVFEATSNLRRRYESGEYLGLLQDFLPLYSDKPELYTVVSALIESMRRGDSNSRLQAEDILSTVMGQLDERTEIRFKTPVNLLVALDVLFRVTVLQRRMASEVQRVFCDVLQSEVSVCDDTGEEIHIVALEAEEDDREFFGVLRMVVERWGLHDFVRQVRAGNAGVAFVHDDMESDIRAKLAIRIAPMFMELDAA